MRKVWTDPETEALRAAYPSTPWPELLPQFNCTAGQLRSKAYQLGLKRDPAFKATAEACALLRAENAAAVAAARRRPLSPRARASKAKPVGTEAMQRGVLHRRVSMTGHRRTDWRPVHELEWVAEHGPLPPGYRLRVTTAGVRLASLAQILRENDSEPPEVKSLRALLGHLKRAIRERETKL